MTKVVLHLRDDANEFLNAYQLREIITKYSDHISFPIVMDKDDEDDKDNNRTGEDTVNSATALWTRNKKDIKDDEYNEFWAKVKTDHEGLKDGTRTSPETVDFTPKDGFPTFPLIPITPSVRVPSTSQTTN